MKTSKNPIEKTTLVIEFAENGTIVRDPEVGGDVMVALTKDPKDNPYGFDHDEEYKLIGRRIYNWLKRDCSEKYIQEWFITGAQLEITATLEGWEWEK